MRQVFLIFCLFALFSSSLLASRTEALAYLDALNAKWVEKDYTGLKSVTDQRLIQSSDSDLAALFEKCAYHSFFELNASIISLYLPKAESAITSIDWSNHEGTKVFVEAGMEEFSNPAQAIEDGIIFAATAEQIEALHDESPTEYPALPLLHMIVNAQYPE